MYIDVCFINIYMHVLLFVSQVLFFFVSRFFPSFLGYLGQVSIQDSMKWWISQILHIDTWKLAILESGDTGC